VAVAEGARGGGKERSAGCLEPGDGGTGAGWTWGKELDGYCSALKTNKLAVVSFVAQRRHSHTVQWYHAVHKCKTAFNEYGESKNES